MCSLLILIIPDLCYMAASPWALCAWLKKCSMIKERELKCTWEHGYFLFRLHIWWGTVLLIWLITITMISLLICPLNVCYSQFKIEQCSWYLEQSPSPQCQEQLFTLGARSLWCHRVGKSSSPWGQGLLCSHIKPLTVSHGASLASE